jgi:uncharacterized protein DUF222
MSVDVIERDSISGAALTGMHERLDDLLTPESVGQLAGETDAAILNALRAIERLRRRLAALDHQLIVQAERRSLGYTHAARDTAGLLASALRIGTREAHARVKAAADCGPRTTLQGEPLPPVFDQVAAAQACGGISTEHARTIVTTMRALPGDVDPDYAQTVHDTLLHLARVADPDQLGKAARHALILAEQDGKAPAGDEGREQRRGITLRARPDGSATISGTLNPECSELLQTYLDAHAAPRPATSTGSDAGGSETTVGVPEKDRRSGAQRRHDALLDALKTLLRSDDVTSSGGAAVTVLLTMTCQAWRDGRGHACTGHGAVIPAAEAIRWAGGDARVMTITMDKQRAVAAYSGTRRIFTRNQRLAMDARDRGCTFPGCTAPPGWCEAHHVTDYARTGTTSIDDSALVCGYDHRERPKQGWTSTMIDGRPHWVPPPWIDPTRTPIRNTLHDLG